MAHWLDQGNPWLERGALRCRCPPCGLEPSLMQDFHRNIMLSPSQS